MRSCTMVSNLTILLQAIWTYNTAMAMYGQALMNPTIQEFFSQLPAASQTGPESGIPRAAPKVKLAPFEPVWSQPWMAAAIEFMMMVK